MGQELEKRKDGILDENRKGPSSKTDGERSFFLFELRTIEIKIKHMLSYHAIIHLTHTFVSVAVRHELT